MGRFSVTATCGEAADAADRVSQGEAGGEGVARAQGRHLISPDIPGGGGEGGDQASGENSASLQRSNTENFTRMCRVVTPLIDDVEHLRANNSAQHNENAEVPRLVAVNSQALGIAHADP